MSKRIRHASWLIVIALLLVSGYSLSSKASTEAADAPVPQATCASIKCLPGQVCVNTLQCTPSGDCFHVGRCVSPP